MMSLPIAGHWFEKQSMGDDVTLIFEPHVVPLLRCNIWHVRGRDRDLMIDTGVGISSLRTFAADILDKPVTAVATHAHVDHIGSHHEFDDCLAHPLEAEGLLHPSGSFNLIDDNFNAFDISTALLPSIDGYEVSGPLITALPSKGYDLRNFRIRPAENLCMVGENDVVNIGNRAFEVLHLPGHSPGAIALWEPETGILFSGDAIYDGPLIYNLHHSNIDAYVRTMHRLLELPVRIVHAGHEPSFGRDRLRDIALSYLKIWEQQLQAAASSSICASG
jgi:glyoxylase-like metal-dependent hydrolase (beta-lactamase superfamily II)